MKFGKHLKNLKVDELEGKGYVSYEELKGLIKDMVAACKHGDADAVISLRHEWERVMARDLLVIEENLLLMVKSMEESFQSWSSSAELFLVARDELADTLQYVDLNLTGLRKITKKFHRHVTDQFLLHWGSEVDAAAGGGYDILGGLTKKINTKKMLASDQTVLLQSVRRVLGIRFQKMYAAVHFAAADLAHKFPALARDYDLTPPAFGGETHSLLSTLDRREILPEIWELQERLLHAMLASADLFEIKTSSNAGSHQSAGPHNIHGNYLTGGHGGTRPVARTPSSCAGGRDARTVSGRGAAGKKNTKSAPMMIPAAEHSPSASPLTTATPPRPPSHAADSRDLRGDSGAVAGQSSSSPASRSSPGCGSKAAHEHIDRMLAPLSGCDELISTAGRLPSLSSGQSNYNLCPPEYNNGNSEYKESNYNGNYYINYSNHNSNRSGQLLQCRHAAAETHPTSAAATSAATFLSAGVAW
eukprot:g2959.t1